MFHGPPGEQQLRDRLRWIRSRELRTPGSAKHGKTRAELAASVHRTAAALSLPDSRARRTPGTHASRPPPGSGAAPGRAPPRYAMAAPPLPAGPGRAPPQGHVTGSQRRHVGRGGKRRPPSGTASRSAQGAAGRPSAPAATEGQRGCVLTGRRRSLTHPSSPQTKRGVIPFPRAMTVLGALGLRVHPATPPAGPSALAAPGCAPLTEPSRPPLRHRLPERFLCGRGTTARAPEWSCLGCPARSGL